LKIQALGQHFEKSIGVKCSRTFLIPKKFIDLVKKK